MRLAHQLAVESEHITADMVEAMEFPQLAMRYSVMGVPKTVVNETASIDGMMDEGSFVDAVLVGLKQT